MYSMRTEVVPSLHDIKKSRQGMNFEIRTEKTPCEMMTIDDIMECVT